MCFVSGDRKIGRSSGLEREGVRSEVKGRQVKCYGMGEMDSWRGEDEEQIR